MRDGDKLEDNKTDSYMMYSTETDLNLVWNPVEYNAPV